jgi:hypothetical protein
MDILRRCAKKITHQVKFMKRLSVRVGKYGKHRLVDDQSNEYVLRRHKETGQLEFVRSPRRGWLRHVMPKKKEDASMTDVRVDDDELMDYIKPTEHTHEDIYKYFDVHPDKKTPTLTQRIWGSFYTKCLAIMFVLFITNLIFTISVVDDDVCANVLIPRADAEYHKVDLSRINMVGFGGWRDEMRKKRPERSAETMMDMVVPKLMSSPLASIVISDPYTRAEFEKLSLYMPSNIQCGEDVYITRVYALYLHSLKIIWTIQFAKINMFQELNYTSAYETKVDTVDEKKVNRMLAEADVPDTAPHYLVLYRLVLWEYGADYFTSRHLKQVHVWLSNRSVFNMFVSAGEHDDMVFGGLLLLHSIVSRLLEPIYWIRLIIASFIAHDGLYERFLSSYVDIPFVYMKHALYQHMHRIHRK